MLERTMPTAFDNGSWVVYNQYIITQLFQALLQLCQYLNQKETEPIY